MTRLHRAVRRAAWMLLGAGVVALGYAGYVTMRAQAYQSDERQRAEARAGIAAPIVSPPRAVPEEGEAIGEIDIPRLGLAVIIAQGDSPAILQRAVGHLVETALPGETGNVVLAGHRDTFFRPLQHVRAGDVIALKTRDGNFDYVVESTSVVSPDDVAVLEPTGGRTLTLITCYPFIYVGSAPNRFIVRARQAADESRGK